MAQAAPIPAGGYNQEARQNRSTSADYIYSSVGDDIDAYMADIYPNMPSYISFGEEYSTNDFTIGVPGQNSVPSSATIYPDEGAAPNTLPRTLSVNAGTVAVNFTQFAKVVSIAQHR